MVHGIFDHGCRSNAIEFSLFPYLRVYWGWHTFRFLRHFVFAQEESIMNAHESLFLPSFISYHILTFYIMSALYWQFKSAKRTGPVAKQLKPMQRKPFPHSQPGFKPWPWQLEKQIRPCVFVARILAGWEIEGKRISMSRFHWRVISLFCTCAHTHALWH